MSASFCLHFSVTLFITESSKFSLSETHMRRNEKNKCKEVSPETSAGVETAPAIPLPADRPQRYSGTQAELSATSTAVWLHTRGDLALRCPHFKAGL